MTADEYLTVLRERLSAQYNHESPRVIGNRVYPLYAHSKLEASKYFLHRKIAYEHIEINEHVIFEVAPSHVLPEDVEGFVSRLKAMIGELVHPSDIHMSSALCGVLVSSQGFSDAAIKTLTRTSFSKNFRFGLHGWCFLRLLGVDLESGQVWANRRGKEVISAYRPGRAFDS